MPRNSDKPSVPAIIKCRRPVASPQRLVDLRKTGGQETPFERGLAPACSCRCGHCRQYLIPVSEFIGKQLWGWAIDEDARTVTPTRDRMARRSRLERLLRDPDRLSHAEREAYARDLKTGALHRGHGRQPGLRLGGRRRVPRHVFGYRVQCDSCLGWSEIPSTPP